MATTIGDLNVKLNLELARLDSQINQVTGKFNRMSRSMHSDISRAAKQMNVALGTIGVSLSVAGVVSFGRAILDLGGKITDLSKQAGLSTDAFQALSLVAAESGVTGEQLALSFVQMRKNVQEAATGAKAQSEALGALNLNAKALQSLAPEKQFEMIAQRINGATDKNAAFNAALDILGAKTAPKLTEVLQRLGTEGFDALAAKTKGAILSKEQVEIIDQAGDKLTEIGHKLLALSAKAFVVTIEFAGKVTPKGGGVREWQSKLEKKDQALLDSLILGMGQDPNKYKPDFVKAIAEFDKQAQASSGVSTAAYDQALAAQTSVRLIGTRFPRGGSASAWGPASEKLANAITSRQRGSGMHGGTEYGAWAEILASEPTDWEKFKQSQEKMQEMQSELDVFFKDLDDKSDEFSKNANRLAKAVDGIWESAAESASSAFADMVLEGNASFDKIASSFARMVLEMAAKWAIMKGMESVGLISAGAVALAGARAAGGPVSIGDSYLVGERGPELFTPKASGYIIPNNRLATATNGGGPNMVFNVDARGADMAAVQRLENWQRSMQRNFGSMVKATVSDARMRGEKL